jgi:hypothetical protein
VNFIQTIAVRSENPDALADLLREWDRNQASADIMGYIGSHLFSDRDNPGNFLIVAEFGVVDPDVPAAEEALRNNDRPETQEWARKLLEFIEDDPQYHHYDELYRTG